MTIASIVKDLTLSQNNFYMIKRFNELSEKGRDIYTFYCNLSSVNLEPNYATMSVSHIDFLPENSKVFCSSIEELKLITNLNGNIKKYFYIWDLEWLRGSFNFMENVSLMRRKDIQLIARSSAHKAYIENYCNVDNIKIMNNWEICKNE